MALITLIDAPPAYITQEQHDAYQSATPASGEFKRDPVLHHLERQARITLEPALDGFPVDGSRTGDVYVTESSLCFFDPSSSKGFSVPYPTVSLHAISRQPIASAGHPSTALVAANSNNDAGASASSNGNGATTAAEQYCVYCQLDENEGADYDTLPEEDLLETKELSIFTNEPSAVQAIYAAMSKCAALWPSTDPPNAGGLLGGEGGSGSGIFADALGDEFDEDDDIGNDGQAEDRAEQDLTPAGRVRPDFVTPSQRFNPY